LTISLVKHVPIVTVGALTLSGTSDTTVVTFTIFLNAVGFFARASFCRYESLNTFEVAWVSIIGHHFCGLDLMLVTRLVETTRARTLAPAYLAFVETITIEL
jgi:hypothetical protein